MYKTLHCNLKKNINICSFNNNNYMIFYLFEKLPGHKANHNKKIKLNYKLFKLLTLTICS